MKNVAPAPPYGSGISTPMIPSSKQASISSRGIFDSSSIFRTRGRIFSSAKSRTTSRKALLVLGEVGERQAAQRLGHGWAPQPSMLARSDGTGVSGLLVSPPPAAAAPRPR